MKIRDAINGMFSDEYICEECGGKMEKADDTVLVCKECGYSTDIDDYGDAHEYDDYYSSVKESDADEPECCKACGGPYPECMTSCKIFDD